MAIDGLRCHTACRISARLTRAYAGDSRNTPAASVTTSSSAPRRPATRIKTARTSTASGSDSSTGVGELDRRRRRADLFEQHHEERARVDEAGRQPQRDERLSQRLDEPHVLGVELREGEVRLGLARAAELERARDELLGAVPGVVREPEARLRDGLPREDARVVGRERVGAVEQLHRALFVHEPETPVLRARREEELRRLGGREGRRRVPAARRREGARGGARCALDDARQRAQRSAERATPERVAVATSQLELEDAVAGLLGDRAVEDGFRCVVDGRLGELARGFEPLDEVAADRVAQRRAVARRAELADRDVPRVARERAREIEERALGSRSARRRERPERFDTARRRTRSARPGRPTSRA